jgi:hypothetical protein
MGLDWLEDLVSHRYRLMGYLAVENKDIQMPKTSTRCIHGHTDIDVLAIKDSEIWLESYFWSWS